MEPIRVAVTGAGSIVGQGIVKSLRLSRLPTHIIATDIAPLNAALYRADEALLLPPVEQQGSLETIVRRLKAAHVDAVMIGSEFDLEFFSEHRPFIERETGCVVVASPPETVAIAADKWRTAEFLRDNGLPYAESVLAQHLDEAAAWARAIGFPLVLKPRTGTSARHVHVVNSESELRFWHPSVPSPMLQRLAGPVSAQLRSEYSCSVFRCADGSLVGPFVSRRTLRGGSSWIVEVAEVPAAVPLLLRLGELLPSMGTLNVQMMIAERGPVPFEFNARFSGTTPIRAHYGFNEPEMTLRSYRLGETIAPPRIGRGVVLRYIEEVFVDGVSADSLAEPFPRGVVHHWF